MEKPDRKIDVRPVPGTTDAAYIESTNIQNLVKLLLAQIAVFGMTIVTREGDGGVYRDFIPVLRAASAVGDEMRAMDKAIRDLFAPELDVSKATHAEGGKA